MTKVYRDKKVRRRSGSGSTNWDKLDRAKSKQEYDKVMATDDPAEYLKALGNDELLAVYNATHGISRYGDYDWNRLMAKCSDGDIECITERVNATKEAKREEWEESYAKHQAMREERQKRLLDEPRLIAGHLRSELASAIKRKARYGLSYGDWLDEPVAALTGQGGFAEEVAEETGIKLEVNLALDCSYSMVQNELASKAVEVFRMMYLALDMASKQLPAGTLKVTPWLWAKGRDGKGVRNLSVTSWGDKVGITDDKPLGPMADLPSSSYNWDGEDTWLYPLLDQIREFEENEGDFGAYRLDIILTDGVLEHPTDSRKGDAIQDRRDGNLQSVILNFLPMERWVDFKVPDRCVQYEATVENIGTLMRQVLGDWVVGVA